jgi:hypothetical protein
MKKKQISLEVVNPNAAGIDIGSRSHWVAVGQNAQDVKEFGVYSQDHQELCEWLKKHLEGVIDNDDDKKQHIASKKPYKIKNKNTIRNTDMNQLSYQYFQSVDLMAIEGVNDATLMAFISEIGLEGIKKFESTKQFTSWLRLAPNNKISGGRV